MNANRFMFKGDSDTNPPQTRRLCLAVLSTVNEPMTRHHIHREVFHSDLYGAGQTIQALMWLLERGLVTRTVAKPHKYSVTDEGRAALELSEVFDPPATHPSMRGGAS